MKEILRDFVETISTPGKLVEFALADVGGSKFNKAIYFNSLSIEECLEVIKQKKNVSFLSGLEIDLMPVISVKSIVARIGQDSYVKSKNIISFDLDFKDCYKHYANYESAQKEGTKNYVANKIIDSLSGTVLSPWLMIYSGNGIHLHYKFKQSQKIDSIQHYKLIYDAVRTYLESVTQFKFDPSCCNPARLMRVPFSTNWKNANNPIATEVLHYNKESDLSSFYSSFSTSFNSTYSNQWNLEDTGYLNKKEIVDQLNLNKVFEHFKYTKNQTIQEKNGRIICSSPFKSDTNPSFYYDKDKKLFYDFSSSQGGDLLTLIALMNNQCIKKDFLEVLKLANTIIGAKNQEKENEKIKKDLAHFYVDEKGVWFNSEENAPSRWLSSPIHILALTRDAHSKSWGRLLSFKDEDNIEKNWSMPMDLLATDGAEIRRNLLSLGVQMAVTLKERQLFLSYLQSTRPPKRIMCVHRIGWHQNQFILPEKVFSPKNIQNEVILQSKACESGFSTSGSLKDWQENVGKYCKDNSKLIFAVSLAFACALLKITNEESGGFHFVGPSSIGKSIVLKIATSIWGNPGLNGLVRKWRSTVNGLEMLATSRCDSLLVLDELGEIRPADAGPAAYMLSGGLSKNRATKSASLDQQTQWRLFFLSSGEISLNAHMANVQEKSFVGQEIRMIDLQAEGLSSFGIFDHIFDFSSAGNFASTLSDNSEKFYGTPIHAFLDSITKDSTILSKIVALREEFNQKYSEKCHGQTHRVLKRFSLLAAAGELAIEFGILPLSKGLGTKAISTIFNQWKENWTPSSGETKEFHNLLVHIKTLLQEYGPSRFPLLDDFKRNPLAHNQKLWGFRTSSGDENEWFILSEVFRSVFCKDYDYRKATAQLKEAGFLIKASTPTRVPLLGITRVLTLSGKIMF